VACFEIDVPQLLQGPGKPQSLSHYSFAKRSGDCCCDTRQDLTRITKSLHHRQ
jgi:hypothetical protein